MSKPRGRFSGIMACADCEKGHSKRRSLFMISLYFVYYFFTFTVTVFVTPPANVSFSFTLAFFALML